MNIGENIRKIRELKGYKREYVARQLNLHLTSYGNIERGQADISVSKLLKIAEILDVNPSDLFSLTAPSVAANKEAFRYSLPNPGLPESIIKLNSVLEKLLARL